MELSATLLKKFAALTNDSGSSSASNTAYGTVVADDSGTYVMLDGASTLTAISEATDVRDGDRVLVSIENHVATVVGNITCPASGRTATEVEADLVAYKAEVIELTADYITVGELDATYIRADELEATVATFGYVTAEEIDADYIRADELEAEVATFGYVTAEEIDAEYIKTTELEAEVATFGYVKADEIDTYILNADYLTVDSAVITDLTAEVANINSILAGNIGAGTIQTVHLTSDNVVIDDAVITDAMIVDLAASKITAGTIYTSLVTIQTAEGNRSLYVTDSLIAMYDANDTQRLQAGMAYESEGYNFVIWDADGTELFNATGVTASGIPSETIVNAHVAENAAISGTKLDISSVAECLNEDGSLTVDAAQITIDDTTLEYRLTSMTTATDEARESVSTLQTELEAVQGQITEKVWLTDIEDATDELGNEITSLQDQYSSLTLTIDGITTEVADINTVVSDNYETLTERIATVEQTADSITSTVSDVQTQLNNLSVGGRNYVLHSGGYSAGDDPAWYLSTTSSCYTISVEDGYTRVYCNTSLTATGYSVFLDLSDDFDSSEPYMVSCKVRLSTAVALALRVSYTTSTSASTTTSYTTFAVSEFTDGEWTTLTCVFTPTSTRTYSRIGFYLANINTAGDYLDIAWIKLEQGNVATDWTPAPEDTNSAITSATTILSSQITQTASEITDTVSALETTVGDNYTTLSERITTVEETADGITSTVSALDATITDNYETLSERITTVEQTADGITSTVSAIQTQFDLVLENRNYALQSGNYVAEDDPAWYLSSTTAANYFTVSVEDGYTRVYCDTATSSTYYIWLDLSSDFDSTVEHTVTFKIRVSYAAQQYLVYRTISSSGSTVNLSKSFSSDNFISDVWATISYTFTPTSSSTYERIGFSLTNIKTAGRYLDIAYVMVEQGDTAHDWEPAPEDNATISYTVSKVQQLSDSLELCVMTDSDTGYLRLGTGDDDTVKFTVDTTNFTVDEDGNLAITGTITTTGGVVGGWSVNDEKIYGTSTDGTVVAVMQTSGLSDETAYIFACGESIYNHESYKDCPFRVNKLGGMWVNEVVVADSLVAYGRISSGNDLGFYCRNNPTDEDEESVSVRIAYLSTNNNMAFGNASYPTYLYGSSITSNVAITTGSDARLKTDISALTDVHAALFDNLQPCSFRYIADKAAVLHLGFTVQDTESALTAAGLEPDDYALTSWGTDPESGELYGALAYDEIIALLVDQVQRLKSRVTALEAA